MSEVPTTIFAANYAVCPKCQTQFPHNKVNGIALVQAVGDINSRKKMYSRLTLDSLERTIEDRQLFVKIRKIVLDNFNDFNRDVEIILGLGADVE